MKSPIIEIKNLTKKFGNFEANKDFNLKIFNGERIGIIGANGAGKTTFVEQLIGISKPTSGQIIYNFPFSKSPQEKMGMQFQESSYPEGLNVKDIIDFSMKIYGVKINKKNLNNLLKRFQVADFYKKSAKSLSGGQQQKLNVLLAIIHNPKVVILDEISTGLDVSAREEIINYVDKITIERKITTILISHNMNEIERLCSRVVLLENGKIKEINEVKEIKKNYQTLDHYISLKLDLGGNNDKK